MRRVVGVRHTSRVHDLDEDMAALVMHSCGHLFPPRDMRGRVDTRRSEVALPVVRRLRAFGDDQPRRRRAALPGGKERTKEEYAELVAKSGLCLKEVVNTRSPYSILDVVTT